LLLGKRRKVREKRLPALARAYQVSPAAMGFAVNASTIGMAIAGLAVAFFSRRIDRRWGIVTALALLAIPTALLAVAPDLTTFTALRIVQGLCMSSAFALTLSYLGEQCSAEDAAGAFAGFPLSSVPVAGKTGTAEVAGKQPHSWFAAAAPANQPEYVVVAVVEAEAE